MTPLNENTQKLYQVLIEPVAQDQKNALQVFKANMKDYGILVDLSQDFYENSDKEIKLTLFVSDKHKEKYLFICVSEKEWHKNNHYFYGFEDKIKTLNVDYLNKTGLTSLFDELNATYLNWKLDNNLDEKKTVKAPKI